MIDSVYRLTVSRGLSPIGGPFGVATSFWAGGLVHATLQSVRIVLKIANRVATRRTLVIGASTSSYLMEPGATLDVAIEGNPLYPLEITVGDETITVYGFSPADPVAGVYDHGSAAPPIRTEPGIPRL
jgi:hypothetical protein